MRHPNKYPKPHQGAQERLRRMLGGWAWNQIKGGFYEPHELHTKRATLSSGWGQKAIADLRGTQ